MGKDVTITNEGATVLEQIQVFVQQPECWRRCLDKEAGGGTALVSIVAGSLRFLYEGFSERDSSNHHFHVIPEGFGKGYWNLNSS